MSEYDEPFLLEIAGVGRAIEPPLEPVLSCLEPPIDLAATMVSNRRAQELPLLEPRHPHR